LVIFILVNIFVKFIEVFLFILLALFGFNLTHNILVLYDTWKVKNIHIPSSQTKRTIKTQKTKDKTITGHKETQMTGQHEPL